MKKIVFILITLLGIHQISAQQEDLIKEMKAVEQKLNELSEPLNNMVKMLTTDENGNQKSEDEVLSGFINLLSNEKTKQNDVNKNNDISNKYNVNNSNKTFTKITNSNNFKNKNNKVVLIDESFTVRNEEDVLHMFSRIKEAREHGLVAQNIWDNFGIGRIHADRIYTDGSINSDSFINDIPGAGGYGGDINIGSEFTGKKNRPGAGYGSGSGDLMDPSGSGFGNSNGYMGDGLGNNYKNGNRGNSNNNNTSGNNGGGSGEYNGQMGSSGNSDFNGSGYRGEFGGSAGYGGSANGGIDNDSNTVWTINSTHSSSQHSGSGGYSSFTHHHDEVSNNKGYSSVTDKQSNTNEDGTTTTRVVVTQTQSDGSSKTVATTTTTDKDGNSHTERTTTEKNSDGEVTNQETTESNDPEKEGDDSSCERPDDGSYDNRTSPPNDAEMQSAVWRAVLSGSLAGGRGDNRTGQGNDMSGNFSPQDLQNQRGYMEQKTRGGKINVNKINTGNVDPSGVNQ